MAGLEGIDASSMEVIDALGGTRWMYDAGDRVARPVVRHTDFLPVAVLAGEERVIEKVRFGLPVGPRVLTNARDDKVASSPAWKGLLKDVKTRGLAAISYVVERDAAGNAFRIQRADGGLIVVPALVARRHYKFASTGNEYDDLGHVQVTADANAFVAQVHDRFVVELATRKERDAWMETGAQTATLQALLRKAPEDRYERVPIDPEVWTKRDAESVKPRGEPVRGAAAVQQRL